MLDKGIIEPALTEWASTHVFASNKDGTLCFCVDYRKLNVNTLRDSYPLPRMDRFLDSLGDASIFSTLNASSSYR